MANIQPFNYQESTNIEEHNQIVNKVNEIVEVINNANLETINSEIANLKTKATETDTEIASIKNKDTTQDTEIANIKNKDTTQDTEIANIKDKDTTQDTEINGITKNLVSNVTATFDNPTRELKISLGREVSPSIDATVVIPASSETGQYSAGNGITIENYQIAVDTGVVALKTEIPVVPDVSEITNRLDTIDSEITGINADITNLTNKNTEQDTAINSKVAIAQGTENAGKVLGIGNNGNVTPIDGGGKKLYTGAISDLISYDSGTNIVTVNKEFDIEYIYKQTQYSYSTTRITVSKATLTVANGFSHISLGDTLLERNKDIGCYIFMSDGVIGVSIYSSDATQLTTIDTATGQSGKFFRLYV